MCVSQTAQNASSHVPTPLPEGRESRSRWLTYAVAACGISAASWRQASAADLQPEFFDKGLAFMFESSFLLKLTGTENRPVLDITRSDSAVATNNLYVAF